jgi:lipopolysaccharide biosynthesis glycosyltransferase
MTDTPYHCVFSVDGEFSQHLCVTLASLLTNNRRIPFALHIIHENVPARDLERLKTFVASFENAQAIYYAFDSTPYQNFRLDKHISIASYFRIFLPQLLPHDIDRLLYLDSDLVVLGDLSPILDLDLGDNYLAAAPNLFTPDNAARMGLPPGAVYFNAGVLLINLKLWRETHITERLVAFINANAAILKFHDQDALNAVMQGAVVRLDYRWNFQARTVAEDLAVIGEDPATYDAYVASVGIIHYTTYMKPWHYRWDVQFKDAYERYLEMTPYRGAKPRDRTIINILRKELQKRPTLHGYVQLIKRRLGIGVEEAQPG